MRFMFVCAGTAGHINPALAVAGELRDIFPDAAFLFVGAGREMEKRLIPQEGYPLENLRVTGLARGFSSKDIRYNIRTLNNLVNANADARRVVEDFRPDCVIGTGGYVCYPVVRAARRLGIPTVLHESNAEPGMANLVLSGMVDRMLVAFPNTEKKYRKPKNVIYTGTPVRGDFLPISREEARKRLGLSGNKPLVVSFWGSLGASAMNTVMSEVIAMNAREDAFLHIHATGGGEEGLRKMYTRLASLGIREKPQNLDLRAYINDMGTVMTAADIVVCRAGASTLAELTNVGRAAVLVPSPNVTANHQEKNAEALQNAGGGVMIREKDCTAKRLFETIKDLASDRPRLDAMERDSRRLGQPEAREKIAEIIVDLVQ